MYISDADAELCYLNLYLPRAGLAGESETRVVTNTFD